MWLENEASKSKISKKKENESQIRHNDDLGKCFRGIAIEQEHIFIL